MDGLVKDFGENTTVYKKAKAVFAQVNMPKNIVVITYKEEDSAPDRLGTSGNIVKAAEEYFF